MRIHSFPPIARRDSRVLILGSMPSEVSLNAREYYAHPRNGFWPILGHLLGFDPRAPYAERRDAILAAGIAIWDVLASCVRPGSADANIEPESIIVNDFSQLFVSSPEIRAVYCNGTTAYTLFRRLVQPTVANRDFALYRLPSTSPANASLGLAEKIEEWRKILSDVR